MQNDIKHRETAARMPKALKLLALSLYAAAASAFIPASLFGKAEVVSSYVFGFAAVVLAVIGFLLSAMLATSIKPVIPYGIVILFIFMMFGTPSLAALLPLLFMAISFCAYVCSSAHPALLIIIGAASYAMSVFTTGSFFLAALSLVTLPAGYLLYRAYRSGTQRVGVICRISVALGLFFCVFALAWLYIYNGAISLDIVKDFFESLREGLIQSIADTMYITYNQISEGMLSAADAMEISSLAVTTVFNFLPALFIIILFIIAYITHSFYIATVIPITRDEKLIRNAVTFKMSVASAIVFIIAFFASVCLSYDGYELYSVAAQNLYIIFFPGLTLISFSFVRNLARGSNASCLGFLLYIFMFGMLIYSPQVLLPLASFGGAAIIIVDAFKTRKKNKK